MLIMITMATMRVNIKNDYIYRKSQYKRVMGERPTDKGRETQTERQKQRDTETDIEKNTTREEGMHTVRNKPTSQLCMTIKRARR